MPSEGVQVVFLYMQDQTGEVSTIISARLMQVVHRLFPFPEKKYLNVRI